jgi:hypothetical protein
MENYFWEMAKGKTDMAALAKSMGNIAITSDAEDIKATVKELICELRDNIFQHQDDISALLKAEVFFEAKNAHEIAELMVKYTIPYKAQIQKRDESFFLEQKDKLFASFDKGRVDHFASMIKKDSSKGGLKKEDKEILWSYFDTLVALAESHKKIK